MGKSNEKLAKDNEKLQEKEENSRNGVKKRDQMIEDKVKKMCKAKDDELKRALTKIEELQETD